MAVPQVEQGAATVGQPSDQPIKGEAAATNQAIAEIPKQQAPAGAEAQQPLQPIQMTPPPSGQVPMANEQDNMLFGPTGRPMEPLTYGATGKPVIPPNIVQKMAPLIEASRAPDASPALKGLVQLMLYHVQNS